MSVEQYYKLGDIGIIAAAGLNFRLNETTYLTTGIAYYKGLKNISKVEKDIYNRNVQLNVGVFTNL